MSESGMRENAASGRSTAPVDVRAFPSELSLLLALLAASVLTNDFFFAYWLASLGTPAGTGEVFGTLSNLNQVVAPGLLAFALVSRLRIRRCVPLEETPFREATRTVRQLVGGAGLRRAPKLLVGRRLRSGAHVAGPPARPSLVLGPELLALHDKGGEPRRVFEMVVRHEIAHLQAKDISLYFLMTLLRWSNVYAGLFMVFALTLDLGNGFVSGTELLLVVVRVLLLMTLGELIARAFLRLREHHADLRGGTADRDALITAMRAGTAGAATGRLGAWLRHHPLGAERLGVAQAPGRILASSPGRLFLGATVAGVLFETLQDMLRRITDGETQRATPILCGVAVGTALTLFLAFGLWRQHWYAGGTGPVRLTVSAVVLSVGVVAGTRIALYTEVSLFSEAGAPLAPSLLAALFCGTLLLCGWIAALGTVWHRRDPRAQRMPRFLALAVPSVCVVGGWVFALLWTWAARLQGVRLGCSAPENRNVAICLSPTPERDIAAAVFETFGPGPVLVLVAVVAVGAPLLARSLAGRPDVVPGI
ncbi:M48 family metalloprotease [Streptomyces sp. NPDC088116]|uniref:M48 family metalloprotease n=1 Tax=Streptomyces sp. NPDC088116 TaxID=3365825 RepID=UPI00381F738A